MTNVRRGSVAPIAMLVAALAAQSSPASAQSFPAGPVRVIVPYAPGGATDVIGRAVFEEVGRGWGQTVVIENRPGAGTNLGAEAVARSAPDGSTLLVAAEATFAVNPHVYARQSYDLARDFVRVVGLGLVNQVLTVHPSAPAASVADFIALAKARPGELTYATFGVGSSSQLNMEMQFVPLSGSPVEFAAFVKAEAERWGKVIRDASIKVE